MNRNALSGNIEYLVEHALDLAIVIRILSGGYVRQWCLPKRSTAVGNVDDERRLRVRIAAKERRLLNEIMRHEGVWR